MDNPIIKLDDIDAYTAISVLGNIQLASRHPKNNGPSQKLAEKFARQLQKKIDEALPEQAALMEMGWNPDFDMD